MDYKEYIEVMIDQTDTGLQISFKAKKPCTLTNPDGSSSGPLETGQEILWEYIDLHPPKEK